jgi:hypothetical protein
VSWSSVSWSSVSWSSDYWELDDGTTRTNASALTEAELALLIQENSPKTQIFLPVIATEAK